MQIHLSLILQYQWSYTSLKTQKHCKAKYFVLENQFSPGTVVLDRRLRNRRFLEQFCLWFLYLADNILHEPENSLINTAQNSLCKTFSTLSINILYVRSTCVSHSLCTERLSLATSHSNFLFTTSVSITRVGRVREMMNIQCNMPQIITEYLENYVKVRLLTFSELGIRVIRYRQPSTPCIRCRLLSTTCYWLRRLRLLQHRKVNRKCCLVINFVPYLKI